MEREQPWRDQMRRDEKRVIILFVVFGVSVIMMLLALML